MAETYDKNQQINASDENFENLRDNLYTNIIGLASRHKGIGTSSFNLYSKKEDVSSSISSDDEKQHEYIEEDPFVKAINVIYDIVNNNYMNMTGLSTQKTNIINNGNKTIGSIIPALSDYFTVVNTWKKNASESNTHCNGACVGFCTGNCAGDTLGATGSVSPGTVYGYLKCGAIGDCHTICRARCSTACTSCGTACSKNCGSGSCSSMCKTTCTGNCKGTCSTGCHTGCSAGCQSSSTATSQFEQ